MQREIDKLMWILTNKSESFLFRLMYVALLS
jgi:hypothetical protein